MLLTKLGHACVRLEKNGVRLVIDPGIWAGPGPLELLVRGPGGMS